MKKNASQERLFQYLEQQQSKLDSFNETWITQNNNALFNGIEEEKKRAENLKKSIEFAQKNINTIKKRIEKNPASVSFSDIKNTLSFMNTNK